jgi:beta-glucosidase
MQTVVCRGSLPIVVCARTLRGSRPDDPQRIEYVQRALEGVLSCIADGIDVRGYTYWSLMDNFEWAFGYRPRFGIIEVDRATQRRTVKPSGEWLSGIVRANAL